MLDHELFENGTQFVIELVSYLCTFLGAKKIPTTAYYLKSTGQAEPFNFTLSTRLRLYVAGHEKDSDHSVQPLTYEFNTHMHRSMQTTPYSLVLTRRLPGPATFDHSSAFPANATSRPTKNTQWFLRAKIHAKRRSAEGTTEQAQQQYKAHFGRWVRCQPQF